MFSKSSFKLSALIIFGAWISLSINLAESNWKGVRILPEAGKLRIEIDGEFFSDYIYEGFSRPFFYPVIGPKGLAVTRNWPMNFEKGEAKDHPHHRSLWYAHGEINGHDFWSESDQAGTTQHVYFKEIVSGNERAHFVSFNRLLAKDGTIVATDTRKVIIHRQLIFEDQTSNNSDDPQKSETSNNSETSNDSDDSQKDDHSDVYDHSDHSDHFEKVLDFHITIHASHGDLVLGDTKEGSMAIRLAPTMRLRGEVAQGQIINSEGVIGEGTWGKRARWVDYFGIVKGETIGVAIFDHPKNPRHPTWWHVRKYGLFAANPFGIHDFERRKKGVGDFPVPSGSSESWKYRFLFHLGNAETANIESHYQQYQKGN